MTKSASAISHPCSINEVNGPLIWIISVAWSIQKGCRPLLDISFKQGLFDGMFFFCTPLDY